MKSELKEREMIKYSVGDEICEPNVEWNYDKRKNRKIIKSLLK